jgi:hypothetical protein
MSKRKQKVWVKDGNRWFLTNKQEKSIYTLENKVYELIQTLFGFGLEEVSDKFEFDYKIYGLEQNLINRTLKYYNNSTSGNLGVLLNGLKGGGKTVTAKILANELNQPVILIPVFMKGGTDFVNSLPQNITVFIDEYEKVYANSSELLSYMDGSMSSAYRRVFLLTMNTLNIDENLLDRPSRVRYKKNFGNLFPAVVEEIVDDLLIHKDLKEACIHYISTIDIITVDIVKTVLTEVNIHNESPEAFKDMFNVTVKNGKFKVSMASKDPKVLMPIQIASGIKCAPAPDFRENTVGNNLYVNGYYLGNIVEVLGYNRVKVKLPTFIDESLPEEDKEYGHGYANPYNLPTDESVQIFSIYPDYTYNDSYRFANAIDGVYEAGNVDTELSVPVPVGEEYDHSDD